MARRPLAAALIMGAGALVLTGCIPMPPPIPQAPSASAPTTPTESTDPAAPGTTTGPSEPSTGAYDFTVDDGAGDVWAFTVTALEPDPPMQSGSADAGTYFVGILFDAEHLEGSIDFAGMFDIFVVGSDGVEYDWRDTIAVTAEDDIYYADQAGFSQARAVVQLPQDVEPAQVVLRPRYGDAQETIIEVR